MAESAEMDDDMAGNDEKHILYHTWLQMCWQTELWQCYYFWLI